MVVVVSCLLAVQYCIQNVRINVVNAIRVHLAEVWVIPSGPASHHHHHHHLTTHVPRLTPAHRATHSTVIVLFYLSAMTKTYLMTGFVEKVYKISRTL